MPNGRGILPDLTKTYEWLDAEENVVGVQSILADMTGQPIFLNVDDPATDHWTWHAADELALESHDVGTRHAVRRYLQPFHRLLKAAGVLEADYPDADTADEPSKETQERVFFKEVRGVFNEQRMAGRLIDVVFIPDEPKGDLDDISGGGAATEDVLDDNGEHRAVTEADLRGHRCFLAGCSPTFKAMFTGEFEEGKEATPSNPQVVRLPHSAFAISAALGRCFHSLTEID